MSRYKFYTIKAGEKGVVAEEVEHYVAVKAESGHAGLYDLHMEIPGGETYPLTPDLTSIEMVQLVSSEMKRLDRGILDAKFFDDAKKAGYEAQMRQEMYDEI